MLWPHPLAGISDCCVIHRPFVHFIPTDVARSVTEVRAVIGSSNASSSAFMGNVEANLFAQGLPPVEALKTNSLMGSLLR